MRKVLAIILCSILILATAWYTFLSVVPYSEGTRAGELIKFSNKGVLIKTWEGQISQGISGAQIFSFSVLDKNATVIERLKAYQGEYVKLSYIERFDTFMFWGDTKYFITDVRLSKSPHFRR